MNEQHKWLIEMFNQKTIHSMLIERSTDNTYATYWQQPHKKTIHKLQFKLQQKSDGKYLAGISLVWSLNRKRFCAVFSVGE